MSDYLNKEVWLIGAGTMAIDYVKVLHALGIKFKVIGRGESSAKKLCEVAGCEVTTGGIEKALADLPPPEYAIIATGIEQLAHATSLMLNSGVRNILVEKPGGFYEQVEELALLAEKKNANVVLGYNRRFYAAVLKAKEIINEDGGVSSFNFEFTEWAHTIEPLQKASGVKEQWLLGNSSHVIDLAFYLGGKPKEMSSFVKGSLSWHPSASAFAGAGVSETGALFSYHANWASPGRWSVEVLTEKHRLIFRPMEKLQIQKIGSVAIEDVAVDYKLDSDFKPGLFCRWSIFLNGNTQILPTIQEQLAGVDIYKRINFSK